MAKKKIVKIRSRKKHTEKCSKEARKRVSTGIAAIDKLLGGFKEGSINLVVGGAGSGKTILAVQFLLDGIKKGENGLYITFEEKKEKIFNDMKSFGWELEKFEKENKFTFLEYTPEQVKRLITEGGGEIENIIEKSKIKRIVLDSITSFSLLYQEELTKKEAALALFELISKWCCTALLTSQSFDDKEIYASLEFEVDSIILLYHTLKQGKRIRAFEILKMRGTEIPDRVFPLKITSSGVDVNTKSTVAL